MPVGFGDGEAAGARPFIVIKLKPGWALQADGRSLCARSRRITPALPPGAVLVAAMALPLQPGGRPTAAERELARFVHLRLPPGVAAGEALALARTWVCVERAGLPPSLSPS